MTDIIPINNPNPAALFAPGGLDEILARIESDARSLVPDITTSKGRKAIASNASAVARSKTYLDTIGKNYVAELKALPKAIDIHRRAMRDRLDALRDEVRLPLTKLEQFDAAREAEIAERLSEMSQDPPELIEDIKAWIDWLKNVAIDDSWGDSIATAAKVKDKALSDARAALNAAHERMEAAEAISENEERERKKREARIAAEAAVRARKEAEERAEREKELLRQKLARAEAERSEQEARRKQEHAEAMAQAARAAERARMKREDDERIAARAQRNRAATHEALAAELAHYTTSHEAAKYLVNVIAQGKIDHLTINY